MNLSNESRFTDLCQRVGIKAKKAAQVYLRLIELYTEEQRAYHNLTHISNMLSCLDASGEASDAIELAIWFHDAIYDSKRQDNELRSAEYLRKELGSHLVSKLSEDISRLIIATDPKRPRSIEKDEALLIDIDLSILGAEPDTYNSYKDAVRIEYSFVPEKEFREGRIAILKHFLSKDIYATDFFKAQESQARENITKEIETLKAASSNE